MSLKSGFAILLLGLCTHLAASSPAQTQAKHDLTIRVQQCRGGCLGKYATKESLCLEHAECSACWDECALRTMPKVNKSIHETWSLRTVSMLQQDSLVLVDVAWAPLSTPSQCLVTWEVSGGGLMGNLLTESYNVQLSLWPDTKYRVQVTCKNKMTGMMSRSLPLTIDTSEATVSQDRNQLIAQKTTSVPNPTTQQISNAIQDTIPLSNINSVGVPYDDQSSESMNQHTNFIFDWHEKNSDIASIEPLSKPDLSILRITSLSDVQNSLLFDVIAGSAILLAFLVLYICFLRNNHRSSDKAALIEDDSHSYPAVSTPAAAIHSTSSISSSSSSSAAASSIAAKEFCKNPAICSRNALKV